MNNELINSLKFNENGKFKVLMISDFHVGARCNPKLMKAMDALLDYTEPDLVILGGDIMTVSRSELTEDQFRRSLEAVLEPLESRNIPWLNVYGNHDKEGGFSNEYQQSVFETFPHCISEAGPEEVSGVGNFVRTVYSPKTGKPLFNIWAMDSHSENRDHIRRFNMKPEDSRIVMPNPLGSGSGQSTVMFDQVVWYYNKSIEMEKEFGYKIPAMMVMHIPIMEYNIIANNPEETGFIGNKRESICAGELNSGLFMACLQRGDVKGIFCGHEHLIDFQGKYCGITLAYDGALGFNMSAHDDMRGGRLIEVNEDGTFETRQIRILDLMGKDAIRNPEFIEGGDVYSIRKLD